MVGAYPHNCAPVILYLFPQTIQARVLMAAHLSLGSTPVIASKLENTGSLPGAARRPSLALLFPHEAALRNFLIASKILLNMRFLSHRIKQQDMQPLSCSLVFPPQQQDIPQSLYHSYPAQGNGTWDRDWIASTSVCSSFCCKVEMT